MTTYTLSGVCRDIHNNGVASAVVKVFDTATDTLQTTVTADSGGNYLATLSIAGPLYCVAYHANSPDIAGTTLNTLMAILSGGGGTIGSPIGLLLALTYSSGGGGGNSGQPMGLLLPITYP